MELSASVSGFQIIPNYVTHYTLKLWGDKAQLDLVQLSTPWSVGWPVPVHLSPLLHPSQICLGTQMAGKRDQLCASYKVHLLGPLCPALE